MNRSYFYRCLLVLLGRHVLENEMLKALSKIFGVGIILTAALALIHPMTASDSYGEMANVAASIASGHGYSSPFGGSTGATAVVPPLYTWLLACIFKMFGIRSGLSLVVAQLLDGCFLSATACAMFAVAQTVFDRRVADWSAWGWLFLATITYLIPESANLPYSGYWCFDLWETALTTLLITLLVLVTLHGENWQGIWWWSGVGFLFGVAALSNPATLAILPLSMGWIIYRRKRLHRSCLPMTVVTLAALLVTVAPWMIRNSVTFGQFVFLRSNFWMEVQLANNDQARGFWVGDTHPNANDTERQRYARMGEMAYIADRRDRFFIFVQHRPHKFLSLTVKRFLYFWAGEPRTSLRLGRFALLKTLPYLASSLLAIWGILVAVLEKNRAWFVFAGVLLLFPLVYYITDPAAGYRYPIDPLLTILASRGIAYFVPQIRSTAAEFPAS